MSKTIFKYGLWGLSLGTLWWALAIVSAVVASKGGDNDIKAVPDGDGLGGRPLALLVSKPVRGRSWADSGAGEVFGDA